MKILAIESSCDETAVAIVEDGRKILTNVVASSAQMHQKYGGIVPEVAARKQLESMIPVLEEALSCHFRENGNLKDPRVHACLSADRPEDDIFKNIDAIALLEKEVANPRRQCKECKKWLPGSMIRNNQCHPCFWSHARLLFISKREGGTFSDFPNEILREVTKYI